MSRNRQMTPDEYRRRDVQRRITSLEKKEGYKKADLAALSKRIRDIEAELGQLLVQHVQEIDGLHELVGGYHPSSSVSVSGANAARLRQRRD